MEQVRRWWSDKGRRPWGAALTAALLAGLGALLSFLFHLGVVGGTPIVFGVAGLYVAWLTVPTTKKTASSRRIAKWDPVELGVHQVVGGGPLPRYIVRRNDELLAAVLEPAVQASRLVVLRGGSSSGKSRAAYEAVKARLAQWQLDYPTGPATLTARLNDGIPSRTILWLRELRDYAERDGGQAALEALADLLHGKGQIVITTVWPEQWQRYTDAANTGYGQDPAAAAAGRLLQGLPDLTGAVLTAIDPARGGVIDVPCEFTSDDLARVTKKADSTLVEAAAAAAAAGKGGQVTQYLAGVPALLNRYNKAGGDPYGQAVITAAMDATRLGHASPLPSALLQEAAVGYLTPEQRTQPLARWNEAALKWASQELYGAVRAIQPVPPAAGTGVAGYRVADYLDQHGRRTRQDQVGPASLWDSIVTHTASRVDLIRLSHAAQDRGLYRHAAALLTRAAALGDGSAASLLLSLLRRVSPQDVTSAGNWAAVQIRIDDAWKVAALLRALRAAGADDAVQALLARDLVAQAKLDSEAGVAMLLRELRAAGADDAVQALLARDPVAQAKLDSPASVAMLIFELRNSGAVDAAHMLAERAAAHVNLDNPQEVASWLEQLRLIEAVDLARVLAERAAAHAKLGEPQDVARLLTEVREAGADDAAHMLAERAAAHANLGKPGSGELVKQLRNAGVGDAAQALVEGAAAHADLSNSHEVGTLLGLLGKVGADGTAKALAREAAAHASLDNPMDVAVLLRQACEAGADDAVQALLARDPAAHANLDNPVIVEWALKDLRWTGFDNVARALAARAAAQIDLAIPRNVAMLLRELRETEADDAIDALLARDPAEHTSINEPGSVAVLLRELRAAGADNAARTLLARNPAAHVCLDYLYGVTRLLEQLCEAGAYDAAKALAERAAVHARIDNAQDVTALLREMHEAGTIDAARALAERAANAGMINIFFEAYPDEVDRCPFGREPDGTPAHPWRCSGELRKRFRETLSASNWLWRLQETARKSKEDHRDAQFYEPPHQVGHLRAASWLGEVY